VAKFSYIHDFTENVAEILVVSYNYVDGGAQAGAGTDPRYYGVIRILNGKTCALVLSQLIK
jgi:hypothetical protein